MNRYRRIRKAVIGFVPVVISAIAVAVGTDHAWYALAVTVATDLGIYIIPNDG